MTTTKLQYDTDVALTITLASLATDANLLAGRCSLAVDNSGNLYDDVLVAGFISTGTTPTNGGLIEVWFYGYVDGSNYTAACPGTDSNFTLGSGVDKLLLRLGSVLVADATSNHKYVFGPISLASLFGGTVPKKWGVFVDHNTVAALNATGGNHEINSTGIWYQTA